MIGKALALPTAPVKREGLRAAAYRRLLRNPRRRHEVLQIGGRACSLARYGMTVTAMATLGSLRL